MSSYNFRVVDVTPLLGYPFRPIRKIFIVHQVKSTYLWSWFRPGPQQGTGHDDVYSFPWQGPTV